MKNIKGLATFFPLLLVAVCKLNKKNSEKRKQFLFSCFKLDLYTKVIFPISNIIKPKEK